jgi:hypothetical protein
LDSKPQIEELTVTGSLSRQALALTGTCRCSNWARRARRRKRSVDGIVQSALILFQIDVLEDRLLLTAAPVITAPATAAVPEDSTLTFSTGNGNGVSVTDAFAVGSSDNVSLGVTHGTITLANTSGLTFVNGTTNGSPGVNVRGTSAALNLALGRGFVYQPTSGFTGADSLQILVGDSGTGLIGTAKVAITVDPAVKAPATAIAAENSPLTFSSALGNAIRLIDSAAVGTSDNLSMIANNGTLTLANASALTFVNGTKNDSQLVNAKGTLAALNSALDGLVYQPFPGFTGSDSLQISLFNSGDNLMGSATVSLYININNWTDSTKASQHLESTVTGGHGFDLSLLLPNGDVMFHQAGTSANWFELVPDSTGSYANGTWKQLASMNVSRQYFSSDVLPNGDVFVLGGEYASDGQRVTSKGKMDSSSAEIYDPATNVWTPVASDPITYPAGTLPGQTTTLAMAGDEPSEVLPGGDVLVGNIFNDGTEIYDPATNLWSPGPNKVHQNDKSDEESWVKLPNGDILTYDLWSSIVDKTGEAELFDPTMMTWTDASGGNLPILSTGATARELGPALLGPAGGSVLFTGANGLTAYYSIGQNSWTPGPKMPSVAIAGVQTQLTAGDAPGATMPNGDVLLALSPAVSVTNSGLAVFPSPTFIYEFDPQTSVFTEVTPPDNVQNQTNLNSFLDSMLVLPPAPFQPAGQVLLTNSSGTLAFYTLPAGEGPDPSWAPTITGYTKNAGGSYTLTGTQLNGRYEGAAYGDDKQMAENYPIVQVFDLFTGIVYYATTSNWSTVGVAHNDSEAVNVVLPPAIGNDWYVLTVIAVGIPSQPVFIIGPIAVPPQGGLVVNGSLANQGNADQVPGAGNPSVPGAQDNSSPASSPIMLSAATVTRASTPGPIFDSASERSASTSATGSPFGLTTALDKADAIHIAGLNAALDILSA